MKRSCLPKILTVARGPHLLINLLPIRDYHSPVMCSGEVNQVRVLVVCHYYWPEVGAPQARWRELTSAWINSGAKVTVLTGMPNHPTGVITPGYRGAKRRVETDGPVNIVRTWLYATPNEGFIKKTLGHLSFMVTSVLLGSRATGSQDIVVVSSPTFFSIGSAWLMAKMKRAKFVVEVRDLWPAIFVDLGVLTNKKLIRILERLELAAYRSADAVVVVTAGFKENVVRRGIDPGKVFTIPNAADIDFFTPRDSDASVRLGLGVIGDETLVTYTGAHGISQGLDLILDAAEELREKPIHFALVGDGADKKRLAHLVKERGLTNITMLPGVPRDRMPELLAAADICVVPLRKIPLFSTFIPSKMFEYLAMGKAVIGSVEGEAAGILTESGAFVVPPEDGRQLADAIAELAEDPARRERMGHQGREYVVRKFNRSKLAGEYLGLLSNLVRE